MMRDALGKLQDSISYRFSQVKLLEQALTHSSHANEQGCGHNERLEFLGDAVLELAVSQELYERFPQAPEGVLTGLRAKLVSMPGLAAAARRLELPQCLFLGRGEESQGGRERDSLLSDALEAVFGAVFLDGGFQAARHSVLAALAPCWPQRLDPPKQRDYKSRLQELTQRDHKSRPVYRQMGSSGPEHEKLFEVELSLPNGQTVTATGQSVKRAEQCAAKRALELLTGEKT